jgi:hypothetical protein
MSRMRRTGSRLLALALTFTIGLTVDSTVRTAMCRQLNTGWYSTIADIADQPVDFLRTIWVLMSNTDG